MKKIIDWGYVINTMKKLVFIAVVNIVFGVFLIVAFNLTNFIQDNYYYEAELIHSISIGAYLLTSILGSYLLAFRALDFTRSKTKADFVYSMPMSRQKLYLSSAAAVIITQAITLMIIALIDKYSAQSILGVYVYAESPMFSFLFFLSTSLLIIAGSYISGSVTGNAFTHLVMTLGIVAAPAVIPIARYFAAAGKEFHVFAVLFKPSLYNLTNIFNFLNHPRFNFGYIPSIIFTTILAAVYFAVGSRLFKKRTGEHSQMFTSNRTAHTIIKSILSIAVVFIAAIAAHKYGLFYGQVAAKRIVETALYLLAAFILLYTYDMFVQRAYIKKNGNLIIFPVLVVLAFGVVYGTDKYVDYQHYVQIDADKVESINVIRDQEVFTEYYYEQYFPAEYSMLSSSKVEITDRELIDEAIYTINAADDDDYNEFGINHVYLLIKFNYKSGRQLYKYLPIEDGEGSFADDSLFMRIMKDEKHYDAMLQTMPAKNVEQIMVQNKIGNINRDDEMKDIYETFTREFADLPNKNKEAILSLNITEQMTTYGAMLAYSRISGKCYADVYLITEHTPETAQKYMDYVNKSRQDDFENLTAMLTEIHNRVGYNTYFDGKAIYQEYWPENEKYGNQLIYMLSEYGYTEPSSDGNIVRIEFMNTGYPESIFISVDDKIIDEMQAIYDLQMIEVERKRALYEQVLND